MTLGQVVDLIHSAALLGLGLGLLNVIRTQGTLIRVVLRRDDEDQGDDDAQQW